MKLVGGLRRWGVLMPAAFLIGAFGGPALAGHWAANGWQDLHRGYPPKPYGYAEIIEVFGPPCSPRAQFNHTRWRAADTGVYYRFEFHKKLGGIGTRFVSDEGGTSTNLDNDVRGHIGNRHLDQYLRHGIYGYNCRYIRGTTTWSTHAWGIAIDVSSAWEPMGQCYSRVNHHHADIWRDHRWKWGAGWCDAMHFQYANGY